MNAGFVSQEESVKKVVQKDDNSTGHAGEALAKAGKYTTSVTREDIKALKDDLDRKRFSDDVINNPTTPLQKLSDIVFAENGVTSKIEKEFLVEYWKKVGISDKVSNQEQKAAENEAEQGTSEDEFVEL